MTNQTQTQSDASGEESSVTTDQEGYEEFVEQLEGDTHDYLVQYARDDETPPETLQRLILAAVPHSNEVSKIGIEPQDFDRESQFVHERWPDEDGYVDTRLYGGPVEYLNAHEPMVGAISGDSDD